MSTLACVLALDPVVFTWLGSLPVVERVFKKISEVRGVGRVACVTFEKYLPQCQELLDADLFVSLPEKDDSKWDEILAGHARQGKHASAVLINACTPFMDLIRAEECLEHLKHTKVDLAVTTLRKQAYVDMGVSKFDLCDVDVRVDGIIAHRTANWTKCSRNSRMVRVNSIEALDLRESEETKHMADSLVVSGVA